MTKADTTTIKRVNDLPAAVLSAFDDIFKLETDIADLTKQHIKPLGSQRTKRWREIKAESGISREILALGYRWYKVEREADNFESDYERERVQEELKQMWDLLQAGDILNFIDALEKVEGDAAKTPLKEVAEKPKSEKVSNPKVVSLHAPKAPRAEKVEPIKKDDDWSQAPNAEDPAAMTDASSAGTDFNNGEKAGLSGVDYDSAIKKVGPSWHHASRRAKNFKAGYDAGLKSRAKQLGLPVPGAAAEPAAVAEQSPPADVAVPEIIAAIAESVPFDVDTEAKAIAAEMEAVPVTAETVSDPADAGTTEPGPV